MTTGLRLCSTQKETKTGTHSNHKQLLPLKREERPRRAEQLRARALLPALPSWPPRRPFAPGGSQPLHSLLQGSLLYPRLLRGSHRNSLRQPGRASSKWGGEREVSGVGGDGGDGAVGVMGSVAGALGLADVIRVHGFVIGLELRLSGLDRYNRGRRGFTGGKDGFCSAVSGAWE